MAGRRFRFSGGRRGDGGKGRDGRSGAQRHPTTTNAKEGGKGVTKWAQREWTPQMTGRRSAGETAEGLEGKRPEQNSHAAKHTLDENIDTKQNSM
jgi:hypothetical protein